jgi:hypothetical protein
MRNFWPGPQLTDVLWSPRISGISCRWLLVIRLPSVRILVSAKAFPRRRYYQDALVGALANLLAAGGKLGEGRVIFLQRPEV